MKRIYTIVLLTAFLFPIYAGYGYSAYGKEPVGIDFFTKVRSISNLKENKGDIFFILRQPDLEGDTYRSDLYQLVDGRELRLTSSENVSDYFFLGDTIIFKSVRDEKDKERLKKGERLTIFQKLTKGYQEATEWLRLPYAVKDIRLIDGNRFFFTASYRLAPKEESQTEVLKDIKENGRYRIFDELPFWSNGQGDISGTRTHLYYYDKGKITDLSDSLETVSDIELSPDKKHLAYIRKTYRRKASQDNSLVSLNTGTLEKKEWNLFNKAVYSQIQFADNNEFVVLVNRSLERNKQENPEFYRLNLSSGNIKGIYDGDLYAIGNSIGSDIKSGGRSKITFDKDGFNFVSTVIDQAPLIHINYKDTSISVRSPKNISINDYVPYKDGFLVVAMAEQQGEEVYFLNSKGEISLLSSINTALFENHNVVKPIEIKFRNEDGRELNGYILPPANYKKNEKYPAILNIHGGPKATYGTVFFHEMQYWANQGYAVLYTNPTGSNGRGNAFTDLRGKFGSVDYNDLMAFVDAAIEQVPFIDRERLGVTGGSYGGYMTNWIIGHTNRFKAAASQRSISSWISFSNTSDIGHTFTESYIGHNLWTNSELLWEQSPLKYADQVNTPTLFLHSDQDYRCWLVEGVQMYYALQYFEVPTRLIIFNNENHELSRSGKPTNRIKRLDEITRWFQKYL
ncbi:MAG: S9 family peptidase [Prevotella sp.]|jgi:dipeptidyl aminopeptidase/acylaminoacyl peptidase|nr:S9 family peptidase [Prevotella sp.]